MTLFLRKDLFTFYVKCPYPSKPHGPLSSIFPDSEQWHSAAHGQQAGSGLQTASARRGQGGWQRGELSEWACRVVFGAWASHHGIRMPN